MAILMMINKWPNFLQHLVLEYDVSFKDIIQLAQTCKNLHQWVLQSFKAYNMIIMHHKTKNDNLLIESNLYNDKPERQLFQIIYRLHNKKIEFRDACIKNYIPIMEWWLTEGKVIVFDYYVSGIYFTSSAQFIYILDWWIKAATKYPDIITLKYTEIIAYNASSQGFADILDWWFNRTLNSNMFRFTYSKDAIDATSQFRHIHILNWWLEHAIKYPNIVTLKYSENTMDYASEDGYIDILEWWLNAALMYPNIVTLKYSKKAMNKASLFGHIHILNWWLKNSKKYPNLIKLKYSKRAIENASINKQANVLTWWAHAQLN